MKDMYICRLYRFDRFTYLRVTTLVVMVELSLVFNQNAFSFLHIVSFINYTCIPFGDIKDVQLGVAH
jgi:hypothetical protein